MKNDLKHRILLFAKSILDMVELLPNNTAAKVITNQIVRSATSVGANYRAVNRARSDKEFISKLNIVLEESDETQYWLELINLRNWLPSESLAPLVAEANELTAIFVSSLKTVNKRINK
jgi:four helix bundle protein